MQKFLLKLLLALVILSFLNACTTSPETKDQAGTKIPPGTRAQMAAILKASGSNELLFIEVPSPSNFISEKIMLASLAAGGNSNAIDQLTSLLSSGKSTSVGITGKSNEINAITVKRTLERLKGKPASGTVYLIADTQTQQSLRALDQGMNIKLVFVE